MAYMAKLTLVAAMAAIGLGVAGCGDDGRRGGYYQDGYTYGAGYYNGDGYYGDRYYYRQYQLDRDRGQYGYHIQRDYDHRGYDRYDGYRGGTRGGTRDVTRDVGRGTSRDVGRGGRR